MNGMDPSREPVTGRPEQLIGVLVPPSIRRSTPPVPLGLPALPQLSVRAGTGSEPFLLDVARLDASGRFCSRSSLAALAWTPGHRVDLRVGADVVVIGSCAAGRQAVGSRGELTLPVSVRTLAGLDIQARVVLVAMPTQDLLIVHPPPLIARLLAEHHGREPEIHDG
jgi:bifunctional DNA-binding transcriptional regulator/antitoxin component of YhaV-PrlF toxin-antitoxin module